MKSYLLPLILILAAFSPCLTGSAGIIQRPDSPPSKRTQDAAKQSNPASMGQTGPTRATEVPAEASPTPYNSIRWALFGVAKVTREDYLVDFGCGNDARVLITASVGSGCKSIGIELDPARARNAKLRVEQLGLEGVEVVQGDATEVQTDANVGFAYLYPDVLEDLIPKILRLERFVSYMHKVPGLPMKQMGKCWYFDKSMLKVDEVAEWGGVEYTDVVCGDLGCGMCYGPGGIQDQLNQKKAHNSQIDRLLKGIVEKPTEANEVEQPQVTYTDQTYRVECYKKYCIYETWRTFSDGSQMRINRYRVNN